MSNQVYYQDKWVTITNKVIVTPQKTYDLSSISGLAIRYRAAAVSNIIVFLLAAGYLAIWLRSGEFAPLPYLIGGAIFVIYGGALLFFGHRKLLAYFANGGSTVFITGVTYKQGQAIMHAFTLAKNEIT